MDQNDRLLTIQEAADDLGISANKAYTMAQSSELPAFKLAGKWRVKTSSLRLYTERLAQAAEKEAGLWSVGFGAGE